MAAALSGAAPKAAPASEASGPRLAVRSEPEVVFRWAAQRCNGLHIPDSPARALRGPDGGVALIAAHYTNVVLFGRDFASLAPSCATESRGAEDADPAAFNDRFWVQAVVPLPDGRVLGLASHEYAGGRHPGRCAAPPPQRGPHCWYSAITATVAERGDWRFRPLPMPARVVAASPAQYDSVGPGRTGFFSVSNAVFDGGFAFVLAYTEGVPGQRRGACLLRAPREDLVGGWRAMAEGGEFRVQLGGGARVAEPCAVVGPPGFDGPVRSIVRLGRGGPWVGVFAGRARDGGSGEARDAIHYSLSPDLLRWSAPALLLAAAPFVGQPQPGIYVQYPSLIDHASPSPVFDEAADQLHLYLTRFNLLEDRRRGMDRDLVRFPVSITR